MKSIDEVSPNAKRKQRILLENIEKYGIKSTLVDNGPLSPLTQELLKYMIANSRLDDNNQVIFDQLTIRELGTELNCAFNYLYLSIQNLIIRNIIKKPQSTHNKKNVYVFTDHFLDNPHEFHYLFAKTKKNKRHAMKKTWFTNKRKEKIKQALLIKQQE